MTWETIGEEYGVKTIAYSFNGHTQYGKNRKILTAEELNEGFEAVLKANKTIKRYPQGQPTYVKNLLSRNWFQVKNSEAIFAIGKLEDASRVCGGTGWAVQMGIDCHKSVFVNDQIKTDWLYFDYIRGTFLPMGGTIPKLTENFAGVGTREINDYGIRAIMDIYEKNFTEASSNGLG